MSEEEKRDNIIQDLIESMDEANEIINKIQEDIEIMKENYKGKELEKMTNKLDQLFEIIEKTKEKCLEIP